jgi:anti-sigma-K factor RskA
MSEITNEIWERLHAYHDGELNRVSRWLFERKSRTDPELQRELDALDRVGALLREAEGEADAPDLWDRIALRLPAVDARRNDAPEAEATSWSGWLRPASAFAAAAALTLAVWLGAFDATTPGSGAVRWVDGGDRPVMVLDDANESGVTIIWMLEEAVEGAARGVGSEMA